MASQTPASQASLDPLSAIVAEIDSATSVDFSASREATPVRLQASRYVIFGMGDGRFGAPLSNVLEIQRTPNITPLPRTPPWLWGVTNLRGQIISVVDLAGVLGVPSSDESAERRIMVVQSDNAAFVAGFVVDRVHGIRSVPDSMIETPTAKVVDQLAEFVEGVTQLQEQIIAVLRFEKLLSAPVLRQFEAV